MADQKKEKHFFFYLQIVPLIYNIPLKRDLG